MAFFSYKVKNEHGEPIKGKVEAKNEAQAASILRSRGLLVIDIAPISEGGLSTQFSTLFGIKQDDLVNLTRQLSTMVTAGLPLTEGLSILESQSKPTVAKLIRDLVREIEGGSTFAAALEKQSKYFSKVYIQLVKAGETGGILDEVLARLAENMEKSKEFRSKTKGALIYPVIVLVAMVAVISILMIFVIPKLAAMYEDFGADLPLLTQILIDMSRGFSRYWWAVFGGGAAAMYGFKQWLKTKGGRRSFDSFMLRLPLFGPLRQKVLLTEFARTLSLLLTAGISLLQGLRVVTDALDNVVYRDALDAAATQVEKGVSLGQAIGVHDVFPPILSQMVTVGEETGKLDDVLLKLSIYFQSESEQAVKNLTTAIEPILMLILGVSVGTIMAAIIMPIYNLTSQF